MPSETTLKVVGTRPIRPDGVEKVTGRANFGADRALPGMLYGRIKRSPYAHARIIRINAEKALALPGVRGCDSRRFPGDQPRRGICRRRPDELPRSVA